MAVNAGDTLKAVAQWSRAGASVIQNVFHMHAFGSGTATDALTVDAVQDMLEAAYGEIQTLLGTGLTFVSAGVDLVEFVLDGWKIARHLGDITALVGVTPSATGDFLPAGVSGVVTGATVRPKHIVRKYIGGLTESVCDADGLPGGGLKNGLLLFADAAFMDSYNVAASNVVLVGTSLDSKADIYSEIISATAADEFGYQRRRKQAVGL